MQRTRSDSSRETYGGSVSSVPSSQLDEFLEKNEFQISEGSLENQLNLVLKQKELQTVVEETPSDLVSKQSSARASLTRLSWAGPSTLQPTPFEGHAQKTESHPTKVEAGGQTLVEPGDFQSPIPVNLQQFPEMNLPANHAPGDSAPLSDYTNRRTALLSTNLGPEEGKHVVDQKVEDPNLQSPPSHSELFRTPPVDPAAYHHITAEPQNALGKQLGLKETVGGRNTEDLLDDSGLEQKLREFGSLFEAKSGRSSQGSQPDQNQEAVFHQTQELVRSSLQNISIETPTELERSKMQEWVNRESSMKTMLTSDSSTKSQRSPEIVREENLRAQTQDLQRPKLVPYDYTPIANVKEMTGKSETPESLGAAILEQRNAPSPYPTHATQVPLGMQSPGLLSETSGPVQLTTGDPSTIDNQYTDPVFDPILTKAQAQLDSLDLSKLKVPSSSDGRPPHEIADKSPILLQNNFGMNPSLRKSDGDQEESKNIQGPPEQEDLQETRTSSMQKLFNSPKPHTKVSPNFEALREPVPPQFASYGIISPQMGMETPHTYNSLEELKRLEKVHGVQLQGILSNPEYSNKLLSAQLDRHLKLHQPSRSISTKTTSADRTSSSNQLTQERRPELLSGSDMKPTFYQTNGSSQQQASNRLPVPALQFYPAATHTVQPQKNPVEPSSTNHLNEMLGVINQLLKEQGFKEIPNGPAMATNLVDAMHEVLNKYSQRGKAIQDMVMEMRALKSNNHHHEESEHGARLAASAVEKALEHARHRCRELESELDNLKRKRSGTDRELKSQVSGLKLQLKQSEGRVRAKEAVIDRLKAKLREEVDKEDSMRKKERLIFQELHQKKPRTTSTLDARTLDTIGIFERQRLNLEDEVENLRAEVRELNDLLREKENFITRRELGGEWMPEPLSREGAKAAHRQILDNFREQERKSRILQKREKALLQKVEKLSQQLIHQQSTIVQLQEESENLKLELRSRPTMKAWRTSQRRIEELEHKLHAAVEAGKEAADVRELRRWMDTRSLMDQDRANHRLKLGRMDALPREIAKELLQEACRELDISDVSLLGPTIRKLTRVMLTVPRLQKFVKDICGLVFRPGTGILLPTNGNGMQNGRRMEEAIDLIRGLRDRTQSLISLQDFKARLVEVLQGRIISEPPSDMMFGMASLAFHGALHQDSDDISILDVVRSLVELEKQLFQKKDLYSTAERFIQSDPELLVNRIIAHIQHLFGIKSLDGVFPKINEVYIFVNEMENFIRVVKEMLNLSQSVSTNTVISAIQQCLKGDSFNFDAKDNHST